MTAPPVLEVLRTAIDQSVTAARRSQTVTSAYAMTGADRVVRVDCTSAPVTITLPTAVSVVGEVLRIIKVDTSANAVTINTLSPDTLGPSLLTTTSLTAAGQAQTLRAWRNSNSVNFDDVAPLIGPLTGNASTATTLQTARTINGVSFNGSANITVTAAAGTLTGTTLNATVVTSSLTTVGVLASPHVTALVVDSGGLTVSAGTTAVQALTATTGAFSAGLALNLGAAASVLMLGSSSASANSESAISFFTGTGKFAWQIGAQINVGDTFEIIPSTAAGATTFAGTAVFKVTQAGVATIGNGLTIPTFGAGGGAFSVGAANSGGAGFRQVLVPN